MPCFAVVLILLSAPAYATDEDGSGSHPASSAVAAIEAGWAAASGDDDDK